MVFGLVAGTLVVLLTQLFLIAALMGVGLLVRRTFGAPEADARDVLVAFWIGLAVAVLFVLLWNFAWPVNAAPLAIIVVAGIAGVATCAPQLRRVPAREPWARARWVVLALALASLWIANKSRGPLLNTDSSLYHLQGVLWAKEYAVVPGLANLFGGLAFNNASLLYAAMLDAGPWQGHAHHLANGILIHVLVWQGLLGIARVVRSRGLDRTQGFFEAALLAPAFNLAMEDRLASFVTDVPMAAALYVAACQLHLLLLRPDDDPRQDAYRGFTVLTLLAAAVTFKMPAAPFAVVAAVLVAWWLLARVDLRPPLRRRTIVWTASAVGAIAAAWLDRGAVLSGYLLFPMSRLSLPVDWRAPVELARGEYAYAAHSSFATVERPDAVMGELGFGEWLRHWWALSGSSDLHYLAIPAALLLAACAAWLLVRDRSAAPARRPATAWLAVPPLVAGTVWFLNAPEPRYGSPFLWILAALAATAVFRRAEPAPARARMLHAGLLALGLSPLVVSPVFGPMDRAMHPLKRLIRQNVLLPGPAALLHPNGEAPEVVSYTTDSGLVLNVAERNCWDAPLPCTRNPSRNLRLREPNDLGRGFVIDGEWSMEQWPAPKRDTFRDAWAERERRHIEAARPWSRASR